MSVFPVVDGVTVFLAPPKGYKVDFEHPKEHMMLDHFLIFGLLGPLAFLCLVQRIYTKHFITGGLKIDDLLITLAWIMSIIVQSVQIWSISVKGLCHHIWEMPIDVYEKHMISSYIAGPVLILCNGFSKSSLLTFYLRISPAPGFQRSIWAAIAMVTSYTVIIAMLLLFNCRPIHASWDPYAMADGKCIDAAALYIAIAVANIVSDVVLFIIPLPTIISLKMPRAQKIGAALMFGVGSVTVATSVVRMAYLPSLLTASDVPWVAAGANIWVFIEVNLFIICGAMPTFRQFLHRVAPNIMGSSRSRPSNPSKTKSTAADTSASKLTGRRGRRTGYSQFDRDLEMDNLSDEERRGGVPVTPPPGDGPVVTIARASDDEAGSPDRHNGSQESLRGAAGGISYTKTFQIQYSK